MWLFDPQLAALRSTLCFGVKIDSHPDNDVSGRREGLVSPEIEHRTNPMLETTSLNVEVVYKKGEIVIKELMPATNLSTVQLHPGTSNAIIRGNRIGTVVNYAKPHGKEARVYVEGTNSKRDGFRVLKADLCPVEPYFIN